MRNKETYSLKETRDAYLFSSPLIITTLAFVFIPVAGTLVISFYRDVTYLPERFLLLENYERLFNDIYFWQSLKFTLLFVVVSVFLELILGILFALILNETLPARGLFRAAILIPWAIPIAISGRVWQLIYNYDFGVLNFLVITLGISDTPVSWLGTSTAAFFSIVISDVWKTTPFMTIIILAGLSTIPGDIYKQAMIDGTNIFQRFFRITLPLLRPVLVVALLFRTIDAIRIFDLVYVLTGGGPGGSTTSLSLYSYNYFVSGDFGYGSAVSVIVFLLAAGLAFLYIKYGRFKENLK